MAERKLIEARQSDEKVSLAESLRLIVSKSQLRFTDQERDQFKREKYAEEEAGRKSFVLGRQVE